MKFTIITVCYKAGQELAETLDSILEQSHPEVELVLVDGASPDNATRAVIERYRHRVSKLVSEPDKGIYDAMNKGLALATGDVVGFVNAGDMLAGPGVIAALAAEFAKGDAMAIYGDAFMVDPANTSKVKRYWKGGAFDHANFRKGWMPPHLGTYIRQELYRRHGHFRMDLKVAADYELLFRFFYKHREPIRYVPLPIVRFRLGGASNRSLMHIWRANVEVYRAWGLNGERVSPLIILRKPLGKLWQYLRR